MISKFRYRKPVQNVTKTTVNKVGDSDKMSMCSDGKQILTNNVHLVDVHMQKAFRELFSQLQFSNESALPPDALRKALAESFSDQQRFQLGFMDDAAECFENILLRIHMHIAHGESQDMCSAQHCIPHQKFAMTLVEQTVCGSCGATSEPLSYTQMVHYVSTSTLVYQVRNGGARASPYNHASFGQLLRKAGNMGDVRMCPSHCGAVIQISRTLMNWPEIVSIGLVWNSERPSLEHIMEVFSTIGTSMLLGDIFTSVMEKKWTENCTHNLVGVVTYYGKHYSTFFFHTKLRVWIYFDDATVRQVGPHWEQVVEKCRKGRYQPLLLLYASPDGTPVNTSNAPKSITQICPQKTSPKKLSPSQTVLRRSITPSPEKPNIGTTRRAITPNPECSPNQKPPPPRQYNEYQNLSVIQNSLSNTADVVDGYVGRKGTYVRKLDLEDVNKPPINIHRTLSNGSSSGIEGMSDHMNFPRRRDSGNWSGDRNSASSASSTTLENPYLYLVGKVPQSNVPESPTLVKSDSSSASSGIYDAGYDSYSISSNDSSTMTTLQHMMKIGHLAKIPEDYNNVPTQVTQTCDVLCDEADELLVKSRQLEDEHDLVLALALCNAAATKARAAMNAPYNNPQTLTLARMKHNTCIMRARSLHRRMTQPVPNKESVPPEIRHTREGSSGSGRHSRQNSRDKGQHSRQNSRELLTNIPQPEKSAHKNIEIYATLPKRKDFLKNKMENINIDDPVDYIMTEKQPVKETRSFFSRSKQKTENNKKEKRSRSEDRSKRVVEFTLTPEIIEIKAKAKAEKNDKQDKDKEKDGKSKKQHKIRRKLLMGGLIKRKNRSMPDLTDANPEMEAKPPEPKTTFVDDSNVGLKGVANNNHSPMSGYLSEGHLEFSANNANPNLKKSKLMKKSFYASAGKILSVPKVPPPPPLRTTSQLSKSKSQINDDETRHCQNEYQNFRELNSNNKNETSIIERLRLDQINNKLINSNFVSESDNHISNSNNHMTTLVTMADVHRDSKGSCEQLNESSIDEVDCMVPKTILSSLDLPPYPSPSGSTVHSRQASDEFPPPPPPLDLSALDEHLPKPSQNAITNCDNSSLLNKLQVKRGEILPLESMRNSMETSSIGGETWLRELQAKQAALKIKRINSFNKKDEGIDVVNTQRFQTGEKNLKLSTVKDITSKFELKKVEPAPKVSLLTTADKTDLQLNSDSYNKKPEIETIAPEQIAEELREVEKINASLQETLNSSKQMAIEERKKTKLGKKKSVSFCDQVILVATAEDQEDDSFIPNPILERVLRSAINKNENTETDVRKNVENTENICSNQNMNESHNRPNDNLFDITMRNTMENSKIANPSLITKISNTEPQKSPVENNFPPYSSVSFAMSRSTQHSTTPNAYPTHLQPQSSHLPYIGPPSQHMSSGYIYKDNFDQIPQNDHSMPYNYVPQHPQSLSSPPQITYPSNAQQYPQYTQNGKQSGYGYVVNAQHPIPPQSNIYAQQYCHPNNSSNIYGMNQPSINNSTAYSQRNNQQEQPYPQSQPSQNVMHSSMYAQAHPNQHYAVNGMGSKAYGHDITTRQSPNMVNGLSNQPTRAVYQHPPQPVKSFNQNARATIYQSVPFPSKHIPKPVYQRVPSLEYNANQNGVNYNPYQRIPTRPFNPDADQKMYDAYQRVPSPHGERDIYNQTSCNSNMPKSVDLENSSVDGSSMPKSVVTPIVVNNANNSIPDKTKCNLCRKKIVASSNLYCADCEYYMSRFKPKA